MNQDFQHSESSEPPGWKYFLSYKAQRSHQIMAWCGVFIYPMFSLLDYFITPHWESFMMVRVIGSLLILAMLLIHQHVTFSNEFVAYFSCIVVYISLMWMLGSQQTSQHFFIYALNASTAFLASAIFLLWRWKHSMALGLMALGSFIFFFLELSPLSFQEIISNGSLVLLTIVGMSQLYSHHQYENTKRDFGRQMELNSAYHELKLKNFEINQRNQEISIQKEKLEELNSLKDRLFMIISHDFRSPLHSLKGLIVLLNDNKFITQEEFQELLKGLRYNVDQTYDLLENLLIWTKSQMKGVTLNPGNLSVNHLVKDNMALLKSIAEKKSIEMLNEVQEDINVRGDEDMITLVIRNLMSNAIKFTDTSGRIKVNAERSGENVVVSIEDTGMGMDEEQRSRIFADVASRQGTRKEKGTGLGLMICKEFIEKNGGTIWIESEPGKGSTFHFSLPGS